MYNYNNSGYYPYSYLLFKTSFWRLETVLKKYRAMDNSGVSTIRNIIKTITVR
jgi:hypothetical protein